ncbi:MAG: hypothetical protein F4Z65_03940 [Acidobacteria bacterium]|nr:hypothetical protein [Acidobacteriota bacterium]MYA45882.1 hypothetical protein [Acidobacteriota bacterium]MYI40118.1 hypothetical protein [Acidobacteriota bacterium]
MTTAKQALGQYGEEKVVRHCACPRCKRSRTLVGLRDNFKCADVICDFCGYLAQVKTTKKNDISAIPRRVTGAAWGPQQERMKAGIFFPLFLVLTSGDPRRYAIYYLSADLQRLEIFSPREPLSPTAQRAGWQGFSYFFEDQDLASFVRLV